MKNLKMKNAGRGSAQRRLKHDGGKDGYALSVHGRQLISIEQEHKTDYSAKPKFTIQGQSMDPSLLPSLAWFCRVAEHRSFTRAAAEMGVSAPRCRKT